MRIVFATGNEHKMKEIRMILAGEDMEVFSQREAEIDISPEENGSTFEENAKIKARAVAKAAHESENWKDAVVLADDSGLEIDFLNKEPGVHSARYMGKETPYRQKNEAILKLMEGVPDCERTARFVCAVAAIFPKGSEKVVRGTMEGRIAYEIAGENGFGYDPVFYLPTYHMTSAQISPEKKNEISHRGQALKKIKGMLINESVSY